MVAVAVDVTVAVAVINLIKQKLQVVPAASKQKKYQKQNERDYIHPFANFIVFLFIPLTKDHFQSSLVLIPQTYKMAGKKQTKKKKN